MPPATILVTGAGGFVGRFLLPALKAAFPESNVIGTGLNGTADLPLDITDPEAVRAAFASLQPDFCLHLAGIAAIGIAKADPGQTWRVNFFGSLNIGRAILDAAPNCKMLFVSSSEVYGLSFKPGMKLDEKALMAPMNIYAASKAAAEMGLSALAAEGLSVIRLRPFNHIGPGQTEDFVVPAFAGQIARIEAGKMPPEISVGNLEPERDFLDVRDVCAAYAKCVENFDNIPNNDIVNIASGKTLRIGTVLEQLLALSSQPITVRQDAARMRPAEINRASGNADKAIALLGWTPQISLRDTLLEVLNEARAQHPA
jgi:GDP-4-dehydro-6-deoxy-D-mannose reductase